MAIFDPLAGLLHRAANVLESSEQEVVSHSPLHEAIVAEDRLDEMTRAVHRACESAEAHVAVVEKLVDSITPLTESVTVLTRQINDLMEVLAPLASVERDVGRAEHFFARRHHADPPAEP